ncbi:lytic transglycosylase domain-containing protein [Glaciimonas sp. CA11.2]|uniref:lytic transglycosylase domain-containing protein n=1 Tax=unclassified Glaciimonas TaxID=2644401 RepID=UPI002AB36821|nr:MULTISPECIES: lytic transglycosylase domain-containing protein [unclassified Glaciimonas]MDY7545634.1 lytic transglycosylase domain-containing protein [Glaciimonas sp. CA11.2]MEB0014204.1 lytic transglycosylase domain-containing protein [Glaciimonas sp. Cout2]MEB0084378.1 lytic transglycosylase domain-containing protein [Glaciimonas sp. Gout2]MEB0163881.1 lytic transglycosylase domain-containing protein [Glaciimonas sp. CA11.2]
MRLIDRIIPWLSVALLLVSGVTHAGNQKEEAMADSVRLALSRAINDAGPPKPQFTDINQRIQYLYWLVEMSTRLKKKFPDAQMRNEFLETTWYESKRAGLDPALVLGLIQVESAFRKYALSSVNAQGYMQVMPFWTRVIGDSDRSRLFNMQTNLRYGCAILRMYLDMEKGNLYLALGRYNGSRGRPEYPNAVQAAWKRWEYSQVPLNTTVAVQ